MCLSNEYICLRLVPDFGARIVELIDKQTGRNWIVPGSLEVEYTDDAVYGREQASGWDECFPTVAPCDGSDLIWGERLRDHGVLWGRPWICSYDENSILSTRKTSQFEFQRRLMLDENRIQIDYTLSNCLSAPMPWLWSQHCLLNSNSNDKILLSGIGPCTSTYHIMQGEVYQNSEFVWPDLGRGVYDLSDIQSSESEFALKAYAPVIGNFEALVGNRHGQISFSFSSSCISFVGLWLSYGGWPDRCGVHQIAIEPTNAPADDLRSALDAGHGITLAANSSISWSLSVHLLNPLDAL